jgi:hypothetical protein
MDQAGLFQLANGRRDTFAADSQHVGDQGLRDGQIFRRYPVEERQNPSTKLLVNGVVSVARRVLADLGHQRRGIAQQ